MKALVYTGPRQIEYKDVGDPTCNPGDVLVRVEAVGICGSDMHAWQGHDERRPAPLILGHEAAGQIVSGARAGQRVTVNPLVTCGQCQACASGRDNLCAGRQIISMPPREGAFAEMLAIPERNLIEVPQSVASAHAALAEPIACGWHAVRLARAASQAPLQEARCVIIGGGAIGLGAALVLARGRARSITIVENNKLRHEMLGRAGPFEVVAELDGAVIGSADDGADIVVDAYGGQATRRLSTRIVKPGGTIVHIGLAEAEGGLDVRRMTLQEITFIGTYTYTMADFRETSQAIFDGELGALDWLDERPLADGAQAFTDNASGRVSAAKIVLRP